MSIVEARRGEAHLALRTSAERDWFTVSWGEVYARFGLAPHQVPGVRLPRQGGEKSPWPRLVHRSHLPLFGLSAQQIVEIANPANLPDADPILRRYQREGVHFMQARRGVLLADEQRVGKTPQITYSHDPDSGVLLLVGPTAAQQPWHEWCARRWGACERIFAGEECLTCKRVDAAIHRVPSFAVLRGRKTDEERLKTLRPQAIFVNFAVAPAWSELWMYLRIGTLAVDEAHLAGVQNRRNATVEAIRRWNSIAYRAVMASGTPMYSLPKGLWPILDIVTPGAFGKFWDYATRYCDGKPGTHGWVAKGATNTVELEKRLSEVMLRRCWNDIQEALPPVTRSVELVAISDAERNQLEDLASEIRRTAGVQTVVGHLERMRKLYAELKTKRGVEELAKIIADGHSAIGWTWHRSVAEKLAEGLRALDIKVFGPYHGELNEKERERTLEEARSYVGPHVIIATMASCGTAINLSWASHQVFVELDWVPPTISQAEMRPYDGKHPISTLFLVADCDPDRRLSEVLLSKLAMAESLSLSPGVGTVAEALGGTFKIEAGRTLDRVAELICAAEAI